MHTDSEILNIDFRTKELNTENKLYSYIAYRCPVDRAQIPGIQSHPYFG